MRVARKAAIAVVTTVVTILGTAWGWQWLSVGRFEVTTDNAYLRGDITSIAPRLAGYVTSVALADNDRVKKGDILFRIDDRDYRARVNQAKANVAARQAEIANIEATRTGGATSASGQIDLWFPLLLRGIGLGLLFISLTIIALSGLGNGSLPFGIGIFDFCKQFGGQLGTASLQTFVDHRSSLATTILSAHLVDGDPHLDERLRITAAALSEHGLPGGASSQAAIPVLQQMLGEQVAAFAFDEAFFALVLFFAAAAPALILAKRLIVSHPPKETKP